MPGASSTVSRSAFASRSTAKTFAPSSTKRTVVARPLPQPGPMQPAPVTIATLSLSRKAIEAPRIVDQQAPARGFGRRDLADEIDQIAVIGHHGEIGMRPVGALGREGKARLRPEDTEVRIRGARRQLQPRLSRLRLE